MPKFRYRYQGADGRVHKAEAHGKSREELIRTLQDDGKLPIEVEELRNTRKNVRLNSRDARDLSALLTLLLESGHSLPDALSLMDDDISNPRIAAACAVWNRHLSTGGSFRDALNDPDVKIPAGFRSLAGIGDRIGALDAVLARLEDYYTRLTSLKERLIIALIYPAIVLVVAIAAVIFISVVIYPKMMEMMAILDSSAAAALTTSSGPSRIGLIIGIVLLLSFILITMASGDSKLGQQRSSLAMRTPFIGSFMRDWDLLNWSFAMEVMLSGGVTMKTALEEAAATLNRPALHRSLRELTENLNRGDSLAASLAAIPIIPGIVSSWISVGEKTGKDKEVFRPIRRYFENRINKSIDLATQLMEPVFIIILGGGIIYFMLRYLLPLFRMMGEIG